MPAEKEIEIRYENTPLLVDVNSIKTNPNQPRKIFKEKDLEELAESIKENGIIQPLIVAELENGHYELVAGERRLRAAKKIGLEQVPVVVKKATEREKMIMSIIENVQRSDLNCVEEALAYYQLMNEYKLTQEDVAKKLGKERSTVANFLRVLNLPRPVIDLLQKEILSFGHAKILASVKERDPRPKLFSRKKRGINNAIIMVISPQYMANVGILTIGKSNPDIANDNGIEAVEIIFTATIMAGTSSGRSEV